MRLETSVRAPYYCCQLSNNPVRCIFYIERFKLVQIAVSLPRFNGKKLKYWKVERDERGPEMKRVPFAPN